ncbi:MAG: hypothetical protein ACJ8G4_01595 [Burkholderiales bacterium]
MRSSIIRRNIEQSGMEAPAHQPWTSAGLTPRAAASRSCPPASAAASSTDST